MPTENPDEEILLSAGEYRLKVAPFGASLRGFWRETDAGERTEIVTGYTGAKGKVGGQGDVLIPFPGRVRDGHYEFGGQTFEMERNDKDGPNAIHGFLRLKVWEVKEQTESGVTFAITLDLDARPGYPFALRATVAYEVDASEGLTCRFTVDNVGDKSAPAAAGFHPYFTVGSERIDTDTLTLPFAATLEFENLLPTGTVLPVEETPLDFRTPRPIGKVAFNTCFLHPQRDADGLIRIGLTAPDTGRAITVWMDQAFDYVVLYSGDPLPETHRRRALAIEPMTCGSDGFNHPEWGLVTLAPGEMFSGSWGVSVG